MTIDPLNRRGCMWVSDAVAKGERLDQAERLRCKPGDGLCCVPCLHNFDRPQRAGED